MGYPDHWLVEFGGRYVGGGELPEIWQCGVRGVPADGSGMGMGDVEDYLDVLKDRFHTWYTVNSACRSDAALDFIKCNRIDPDGSYHDGTTTHLRLYSDSPVGPLGATCPSILTCAWSWATSRARGPGAHGRIYPPMALVGQPSMVLDAGRVTAAMNAAKDLLGVLVNPTFPTSTGNGMAPCVVSKQDVIEPIKRIKIGNVIDVQRRRKNQLKETYSVFDGPPWSTTVEG